MKITSNSMLKFMFFLGAVIDGAIAVSWFMIAAGFRIPNILNGFMGTGLDYQLAMYTGAMFMAGWTALLVWGAIKPMERRGLLLITSVFLLLSVVLELAFFSNMLGGTGFILGLTKRIFLSALAASIYFYSFKKQQEPI